MKSNFDEISKKLIIDSISALIQKMQKNDFNINISSGTVTYLKENTIGLSRDGFYTVLNQNCFNKKDLIIILRYLQNMDECRDIVSDNIVYEEVYNMQFNKWEMIPVNKEKVKEKVKFFLERKKSQSIYRKKNENFKTNEIGEYIKRKLSLLNLRYSKNSDVCFDNKDNQFIIVLDKYEESPFGINVIHLIDEASTKFHTKCYGITFRDYIELSHGENEERFIFFK